MDFINFNKQLERRYDVVGLQNIVWEQEQQIAKLREVNFISTNTLKEIGDTIKDINGSPLAKFYNTSTVKDLIDAQAAHILRLQDKLIDYNADRITVSVSQESLYNVS